MYIGRMMYICFQFLFRIIFAIRRNVNCRYLRPDCSNYNRSLQNGFLFSKVVHTCRRKDQGCHFCVHSLECYICFGNCLCSNPNLQSSTILLLWSSLGLRKQQQWRTKSGLIYMPILLLHVFRHTLFSYHKMCHGCRNTKKYHDKIKPEVDEDEEPPKKPKKDKKDKKKEKKEKK